MVIEPVDDSKEQRKDGISVEKYQMVFSITMEEWKVRQ
jgi:hypothetical protein